MGGRPWTEADDLLLARAGPGDFPALAARLGRTLPAVRGRAGSLRAGSATRTYRAADGRRGGRAWTPAETARLRAGVGLLSPEQLARELRRTPTAVRLRAKRLNLRWVLPAAPHQPSHGLPASEVARRLGVPCAKTVVRWVESGFLDGARCSVRVGARRVWRIPPDAVARFLATYRWLYDPGRIADPGWRAFVAALPPERYLTVGEAARRLCYEAGSVNQLIARGDLPARKRGANWRVPESALRHFVRPCDVPRPGGHAAPEVLARRAANLARRSELEAATPPRRSA